MNHVTAGQDISVISLFKEEMVPTLGVFSLKLAQLAKVSKMFSQIFLTFLIFLPSNIDILSFADSRFLAVLIAGV